MSLSVPVALLIFKRPEHTEAVFEVIRQAQPKKLLVIADGPRASRSGEAEKCAAARAVIDRVDWDCEVLKNYSDVNLGCGVRPATGINWVFEQVEEAIILEDDCLPHPTFFNFCEELLEKYRDDERVMLIGGTNHFGKWKSKNQSYHFSIFSGIWGWASWRRAWKFYDYEMKLLPEALEAQLLNNLFPNPEHRVYWENLLQRAYEDGSKTYWDYQWLFTRWAQNGLGIIPEVNLVSNIGFGPDATHTFAKNSLADLETQGVSLPLKHPPFIIQNVELDNLIQERFFPNNSKLNLRNKVLKKAKNFVKEWQQNESIF